MIRSCRHRYLCNFLSAIQYVLQYCKKTQKSEKTHYSGIHGESTKRAEPRRQLDDPQTVSGLRAAREGAEGVWREQPSAAQEDHRQHEC